MGKNHLHFSLSGSTAQCLLAGFAVSALTIPAQAQEAPAATETADSSATTYTPEDFARFAPRNALDMLGQVPGFTIRGDDDGQRGLGQTNTNVLIDGQRVASKSDGIFAQLRRIGTDRVERIELVDGSSLGIPGLTGQIANVITRPNPFSGRFTYRAGFRPKYARPSYIGGEISLSGSGEQIDWTLAYSHGTGRGAAGGGEAFITDPAGAITENRDVLVRFVGEFPRLSGTAKWTSTGGTVLDVNASYSRIYEDSDDGEYRDLVTGTDVFRDYNNRFRGWGYELGGTLDISAGPGRLKLIGLERYNHRTLRSDALLLYRGAATDTGSRYTSHSDTGERIGRAEYAWPMLGGDWQIDAEAAFNRLDRRAALFELDAVGAFIEVPFPSGSGGVTEDRYETILTHSRPLGSNFTLQAGAGAEFSQLVQTGPNGLTRRFWRPKGSLALSWAPRTGTDISFELARRVGQLSFGDFLASVSLAQGNQNAGNAQLVPPQSWEAELEVTENLGAWGSTTLRIYGEWTDDFLELIPAPGGEETLGNIDGVRNYGLSLTSTVNLDPLGFRGAKIDLVAELEDSQLTDPLTGEVRSIGGQEDRSLDLNLRHDIPGSDWAWGVGLEYSHVLPFYRLSEVSREWEGPIYTSAFVEHKDVLGMTARLEVFNITDGRARFTRTVYDGYRDRSRVLFGENRNLSVQPIITFSLSGDF